MHKRFKIINQRTGEIKEVNNLFPEPMTVDGYLFPARKGGARAFRKIDPPELSYDDKGRLGELATYHMVAGANMLGYRKGGSIVPYTAREIGALVGLNARSGCSKFVNKMLKLNILHKVKDISGRWQYYINPAYYISPGYRLSLNLYLLFHDELRPLIPKHIREEFMARVPDRAMFSCDAIEEVEEMLK